MAREHSLPAADPVYRYEDDVFYVRPKEREYHSSIDVGEFIFDLDRNGEVVGLEVLNASRVLHVPKEALRHLVSMKLEVEVTSRKIQLQLQITSLIRNAKRSSSVYLDKEAPEFMRPSTLQMAVA